MKPKTDFQEILEVLAAHRVDFIVVSGVSAVLQGAPIATFDLDIVHSRDPANIERLMGALKGLGTHDRCDARKLEPAPTHLASPGHQLLLTTYGPLDLLGEIGAGSGYETLLGEAEEMDLSKVRVKVLGLSALIRTKEEAGRVKDKAMLPVLRGTLAERRGE